jgi:2-polyprenyl-3-methyl-5-hydroxy-6-metoxy-1,4-benzoquinol methylase
MIPLNACPVCGSSEISRRYSGKPTRSEWRDERTFEVFGCEDCTHQFLNPVLDEASLAAYYNSQYVAYQSGHGTGDLERAIQLAKREQRFRHVDLHDGMDVLDIGCGSGSFLHVIQGIVGSVQGVEPSEHGVATCRELGIPVFHGGMEAFAETDDRTYDLITLNHVLEHHPEPLRLLGICRPRLKKGARIWIAVPNAGSFFAKALKSRWHSSDLPVHLQQFNSRSLRLAMEAAGFRIEELRTESENSLPKSSSAYLRRFGIPARVSGPLLKGPFSKTGAIGRRIDASGHGEALIILAYAAT